MPHHRTTIRNTLEALLAGLATPQNVLIERSYRVGHDDMPLVILSCADDATEEGDSAMGNPKVEESQSVMVEIMASGNNGKTVSESIDQIELEVEQAIGADATLGGVVELILKTGSTLERSVEQDRVMLTRAITYQAMWRHEFGAPDTAEA